MLRMAELLHKAAESVVTKLEKSAAQLQASHGIDFKCDALSFSLECCKMLQVASE